MPSYNQLTDAELLDLLKQGDHSAYTEIFSRYNKLLYNHTYNKIREKEEARDIVHDIFYSLWTRRSQLEIKNNFAAYLFTAVRYKIADLLAKKQVEDKYILSLQTFIDREPVFTDYLVREKQFREIIDEEIAALPPRMREIFKMSRFGQFSHKEIALELGISEQTVKDQVKTALKILRSRFGLFVFICFWLNIL